MKSKYIHWEPFFEWLIIALAVLLVIVAIGSCQDPYQRFEKEHMGYFVTQDWVSTDTTFALFFYDVDKLLLFEYDTSYNLGYAYEKNVLYVGQHLHYKVTGGMIKDQYFITDYLGKRYEVQNYNALFPAD